MDQVKIGKFIAELRRRAGLTQEALGEKIGVTNKTISRWENGDYMPNIEMLQLLAEEFSISISEILAGEKFSDEESRHKADENAIATTSTSAFSLKERKTFFKKKWRQGTFFSFCCPGFDFDCRRRISPGISQTMASRYSTFGRAR